MRKIYTTILLIGLVSVFSVATLSQGKGNRRTTQPTDRTSKNTVQRN